MKYINVFADASAYEQAGELAKPQLSLIKDGMKIYSLTEVEIPEGPANNEIWYTTTDGNICDVYSIINIFVAYYSATIVNPILSNTYTNGKGIITCTNDITILGAYYNSSYQVEAYPMFTNFGESNLLTIQLPNTVTSISGYSFFNCNNLISIIIPNSVTEITGDAFYGCSSLTSIIMPNSVITIGNVENDGMGDFCNCTSLSSITLNNSLQCIGCEAFNSDSSLTSIIIPNSVTKIGRHAFQNCTNLSSIIMSNSIEYLGDNIFNGCNNLPIENDIRYADTYLVEITDKTKTSYIIKESTKYIGDDAFKNCTVLTSINIPNTVTIICDAVFSGCASLSTITMPESIINLGNSIFSGCNNLPIENDIRYADTYLVEVIDKTKTSYIIKKGTKYIGSGSFKNCTALTSINIPNTVITIESYAFHTSGLTSITMPNSVLTIKEGVFRGCSELQSINISKSVQKISGEYFCMSCNKLSTITVDSENEIFDSRNNCNAIINTSTNELIVGCKDTIIPNSVTSIGAHAFEDISTLTNITIPSSVITINEMAFMQTGLTSVTIPNSVLYLDYGVFSDCASLTSIILGSSLNSTNNSVFEGCTSLMSVTSLNTVPPTLGTDAVFENVPSNCTIYVPSESVDAYKAASVWSDRADYIQAIQS